MSSTLYARGTLTQTGVRQRTERMEQIIQDLRSEVQTMNEEIRLLKSVYEELLQKQQAGTPTLVLSPESPPS